MALLAWENSLSKLHISHDNDSAMSAVANSARDTLSRYPATLDSTFLGRSYIVELIGASASLIGAALTLCPWLILTHQTQTLQLACSVFEGQAELRGILTRVGEIPYASVLDRIPYPVTLAVVKAERHFVETEVRLKASAFHRGEV